MLFAAPKNDAEAMTVRLIPPNFLGTVKVSKIRHPQKIKIAKIGWYCRCVSLKPRFNPTAVVKKSVNTPIKDRRKGRSWRKVTSIHIV